MGEALSLPALAPDVAAAVARWRGVFRTSAARRVALSVDDRVSFAGALLAAWAEGKQVVLPGDTLAATVKALGPHVDAFAGDFPGALQPGAPLEAPLPGFDRELEGVVVFTSGSTGAPLAIPKKLRQLFDEVQALEACFGARVPAGAAVVATVSHQHIYGLLFSVLWPLATGRGVTARRYEFFEELEAVLAPRDCVLVTSPAHLKRLPDGAPWTTKVRAVFSSGGPLPGEAAAVAKRVLGQAPVEVYGSSETGGIAWRTFEQSAWAPLPGVQWRLGEDAALEVQSPHLSDAGWFRTADRAKAEGEGFVLLGRADRIAKVEEKRVSLDALERELLATGLLAEARVVLLSEHRVELGVVAVPTAAGEALLAKGRKALTDALRARLAEVVVRVAMPRRFRYVERLPVNAQGKVTQAALELLFAPERPDVTWVERGPARAVLSFSVSPRLRVLDGHFPETPLVPGVAQLDWALAFGREAFGLPAEVARIDALKFQAILRPGMTATLALDWSAEKATLGFKYSDERAVFSSGRFVLR